MYWTLIISQAQKERLAAQNINNQGYEYYMPMFRETITKGGKNIELARPLFPRYIFVRVQGQWSSLTGTYGVSNVLMEGISPKKIPDRIIENLKNRHDKNGFIQPEEEQEGFRDGQSVKVISGPLEGQIGIFKKGMSGDDRVKVLFQMLGSEREIRMEPKLLVIV